MVDPRPSRAAPPLLLLSLSASLAVAVGCERERRDSDPVAPAADSPRDRGGVDAGGGAPQAPPDPAPTNAPGRAPTARPEPHAVPRNGPAGTPPAAPDTENVPAHVWTKDDESPAAVYWEREGAPVGGWRVDERRRAADSLRLVAPDGGALHYGRVVDEGSGSGWTEWVLGYGEWRGVLAVDRAFVGRWQTGRGLFGTREMRFHDDGTYEGPAGELRGARWGRSRDVLVVALDHGGGRFIAQRSFRLETGPDGVPGIRGWRRLD